MSKRPKYDSSRDRENYTFHPGRQFNLEYLQDPGACHLYALDHRQATMLRRMLAVFPKYHWVWGLPSPRKDWDAAAWQLWEDISDLVDETEATLVSGCELQAFIDATNEQTKAIRELTAVVGSLDLDLTQPVPDNPDYSSSADGLAGKFRTSNWIVPDTNLADILANSLMGRYLDPIPSPLQGDGISDILDEVLTILHGRFRQDDLSIPGGAGEKNMAETMETLLRRDGLLDLEFFFPNIVTVMEDIFYAKPQRAEDEANNPLQPEQETGIIAAIKQLVREQLKKVSVTDPVSQAIQDWLLDKLDATKTLSLAEILLMLSSAENPRSSLAGIARAIREAQTIVNVNNKTCCDDEDCDCDEPAKTYSYDTLEDLDDDIVIDVGANGNGSGG